MKGVSTVIATILMLIITIALAGMAYMYIAGVFTARTQGIEIVDSYCVEGTVIWQDINGDGFVNSQDFQDVIDGTYSCPPEAPVGATSGLACDYDDDNDVDSDDLDLFVAAEGGQSSGDHTFLTIRNIGTTDIEVSGITISRTAPDAGPVAAIAYDTIMLEPGSTTTGNMLCPGSGGRSCHFRLVPPIGGTVTATSYCT